MGTFSKFLKKLCFWRSWNVRTPKEPPGTAAVLLTEERFVEILNAKLNALWNALQKDFIAHDENEKERINEILFYMSQLAPKTSIEPFKPEKSHAIGFKFGATAKTQKSKRKAKE